MIELMDIDRFIYVRKMVRRFVIQANLFVVTKGLVRKRNLSAHSAL